MGTPPEAVGHSGQLLVYCLTRDRELATTLDERVDALTFFYNDAARLHQAIALRPPHLVVIDTGAIRPEFGDAGLGPVVAFVRQRSEARIAVRPGPGADWLVGAEAGVGAVILPVGVDACGEAIAALTQ